jgi:thiol-disulfide isomerase/thioredoxin
MRFRKINDRDIDFVLNAAIVALIIMAVLHTVAPMLSPQEDRSVEMQAYMQELTPLTPEALETQLHKGPHMLVIYASWCSYCRSLIPTVAELIETKQLGNIKPLFLSLDREQDKMAQYVVKNHYEALITPHIVAEGSAARLPTVLAKAGSSFSGGIPYIGFFDSNGKLVAESLGLVNKERLLMHIQKTNAK